MRNESLTLFAITVLGFVSLRVAPALALDRIDPAQQAGADTDAAVQVEDAPDAPADEALPPHLADPAGFRHRAAMDKLCEMFAIKLEPKPGDTFMDLLPKGTVALDVVNPGFEFTYENGKTPGRDFWFVGFKAGDTHRVYGGGKGELVTDPIQGWNAGSCAGLESGRPMQWKTAPDGCTGYIVANGHPFTLNQQIDGALKPRTRYTLLLEVFKRNDYQRAEPEQMIIRLTDAEGNDLDLDTAEYAIAPADEATGFAITALTITTSADQKPGDLAVHIGMNAKGPIRFNFDNLRLWATPLE